MSVWHLLKKQKFAPMFYAMLLTAINDNLVKKGLTLYLTYQLVTISYYSTLWTSLLSGLFMLPFFLLSSTGGQLADKYSKALYIRLVKLSEVFIIAIVSLIIFTSSLNKPIYYALAIFLMGCHSALFTTVKYSYLPEYLVEDELLAGNSLLETFTLAGIVLGISLSYIISIPGFGKSLISIIMLVVAISGYFFSLKIPENAAADPSIKVNYNIFKSTQNTVDYVHENPHLWASILGISWFWFMGTFFLEQLPNYVNYSLHADADVAVLFNLISTFGIGLGSLYCYKILGGKTDLRAVPICLLCVSLFGLHFYYISNEMGTVGNLINIKTFIQNFRGLGLLIDLFGLCFACGVYVVPLYSKLQMLSEATHRSRIMAAFNIISALWMVSANLVHIIFVNWLCLKIESAFAILMIINLVIALYLIRLIPFGMIRPIVKFILFRLFKVEIQGIENINNNNEANIIICNHVSYLDVLFLTCILPDNYSFVVDTDVAQKLYMKFVKHLAKYYEVDTNNAMKMKNLIHAVQNGESCVIFPEGRLSESGQIMKIYDGTALLADKTKANIISINIKGVEFCRFFSKTKKFKKRLFPKIRIVICPGQKMPSFEDTDNKDIRLLQKQWIYDRMCEARALHYQNINIYERVRIAMSEFGANYKIVEDISRVKLSYNDLFLRSEIMTNILKNNLADNKRVAVLLPNVSGQIIVYLSLFRLGKTPAIINYTAGSKNMLSACLTAQCSDVITSKEFIEKVNLHEIINILKENKINILYTEELRKKINIKIKIQSLSTHYMNVIFKKRVSFTPSEDEAIILFTSGSEGYPKGVVLSHNNIVSNIQQSLARVDLTCDDLIFNVLPMFHSFGFTLGTFTPLLSGAKLFVYPNPKHYHQVVELIYTTQATIMIGTNTFLNAYQKVADPYDFSSLRYVFTGGEKLLNETRDAWINKFGIRLIEGYGTTECSPVVSINNTMYLKQGSVGRLYAGMEYRLKNFDENSEGKVLEITGPNLMMGYLYADNPGVLVKTDGWYNTGDVVTVDKFGFITIIDRAKRFAKIGGEMISLSAVEQEIARIWPEHHHALVIEKDDLRGEKLVMYTTNNQATKKELVDYFNKIGLSQLALPHKINHIDEMPLLGSGKIDYQTIIKNYLNSEVSN